MTLERFWQTVVVNCEALTREVLPAAAEAAGKPILGTFVVVDLSGFGCVSRAYFVVFAPVAARVAATNAAATESANSGK